MKKLLLFLFLGFNVVASAQISPIQADRPDQTETPAIVPKGMFQLESGFSYQKENANNSTWALPSALWKYGVNENFELRLITELETENSETEKYSGLRPILIGCKIKICEEKGIIPKTSFIGHMSVPKAASSKYKTDFYAPEFRFTMQHTLSDKFSLSYNLGSEWDGFTAEPTFIYTLTTGYSISEKLGSYVEVFGFAPQTQTADHSFDGGITYLINDNFMLDLSAGVGLTENAPDYYTALGFSFRM
ncbi:transporter [Flavobacterium sp.]|uniref:transporter n=1 Tax=Flavobacterium sp. TaxID=239 RepID=UPI002632DC2D|nr:transporter [Flavobacterium sp.]